MKRPPVYPALDLAQKWAKSMHSTKLQATWPRNGPSTTAQAYLIPRAYAVAGPVMGRPATIIPGIFTAQKYMAAIAFTIPTFPAGPQFPHFTM